MELPGAIAWINEEGNMAKSSLPAGFGMEFQDLEEKEIAVLNALLDAEHLCP
jgi:Tfp pilus assembly protein PilZ